MSAEWLSPLSGPVENSLISHNLGLNRRGVLFRSYRNLVSGIGGYESRISLHSNIPRTSNAISRSYHQNDLPSFWLQRSASARNLQSNRFGSVINLGEAAPIAEDEPVNHVRENNRSFNAVGECGQPEHRRSSLVPHSAGPFESHFNRQLHASQIRCPSDVDLAQRDLNQMESQYDRVEVSPAERSSHGSSPDANDHTIIFTNVSPWDSPSAQSTNALNASLSTSQIPLRTVNRQQLAGRQMARNSVPACNRPLVSGISGTLARPARSHIFSEPHSSYSHRLLRPPDAGTVDIARSTDGADTRRPNSLMRGALRSAGSPQRPPDRARATLISSSAERTQPFLDREIRVIRRIGGSNQATPPRTSSSATNTQNLAGVSASSSVEDLQPVEVVATSRPAPVTKPDTSRIPTSSGSDDARDDQTGTDGDKVKTGDWRTNCACSRDMWRNILESERFADVWFIVGGNQVLGNNSSISPCVVSPDSGAPGGPTSVKNYQDNLNRPELENTVSRPVAFPPENDSDTVSTNTFSDLPVSDEDANLVDEPLALALSDTDNRAAQTSANRSDQTRSKENHKNGLLSPPSLHDTQCMSHSLSAKHSTSLQEDVFPVKSLRIAREGVHKRPELDRSCEFDTRRAGAWSHNKQLSDDSTRSSRPKTLDEDPISLSSDNTRVNKNTETRRFGAHRLVLATASPVFEAMFYGPMAEMNARTRQNPSEYHITDIHPRAFQSMLTYIYSDEIELDDDLNVVFYVLYAAKKYLLPRLVRRCVHHLKGQITASNVCMMLDRSLFFDEEDLTRCCWRIIDVLATDVLLSPGLLTMDATNLKAMLQRDTLNCKESEVFAAVRRWSGAECARLHLPDVIPNRAQIAADLLRLVRFPTMTLNDFAINVAYSGFLSLEMVRDLFVHITTNKATRQSNGKGATDTGPGNQSTQQSALGNPGSVKKGTTSGTETNTLASFLFEPRIGPKLWRCSRFTRTRKPLITSNPSSSHYHCVYFQTSAHIFLAGVGMYGSTQIGDQLAVRVELRLFAPKSIGSGLVRVASVGTQFQSSTDMSTSGDRRREHHQQSQPQQSQQQHHHQSGQEQQSILPRSSSLLEHTRFDWSSRPQASGRVPPTIPENESVDANENNKDTVRPLSNTLAVAKVQLDSDGTSRVYDVLFHCPVKIVRGQRYALAVQASHMDRSVSVQSSSSAMNSATTYVGLFGRPEVRVCCCESKTSVPASSNRSSTHSKKLPKEESTHRKKHHSGGQSKHGDTHTDRAHDVVFQFLDFPDENQHGEVERGFLPELLFYTFP